jgi:hypothetical protein
MCRDVGGKGQQRTASIVEEAGEIEMQERERRSQGTTVVFVLRCLVMQEEESFQMEDKNP